jgi:putative oxidoreductase
MITDLNYAVAIATARILTGVLFLFQGYDKVFNIGMKNLQLTLSTNFNNHKIPSGIIGFIAVYTSWIEFICGFLLILGIFKYFAIYLLCLNLVIVAVGFSMSKPMWENSMLFVRLALLLFLLTTPTEWDKFSIDYLFALSKLSI